MDGLGEMMLGKTYNCLHIAELEITRDDDGLNQELVTTSHPVIPRHSLLVSRPTDHRHPRPAYIHFARITHSMALQAEQAFAKTFLSTISTQPIAFSDDYQQPLENWLRKVPILPVSI